MAWDPEPHALCALFPRIKVRRHLLAGQQAAIVTSVRDWTGAETLGRPRKGATWHLFWDTSDKLAGLFTNLLVRWTHPDGSVLAERVGEDANDLYRRADLMALCRKLMELQERHMT